MSAETWGVISDTHGKLDPRVFELFRGVRGVLHAGDICGSEILEELAELGPVYAVFGNNDGPPLSDRLPRVGIWPIAGRKVMVVHELLKPESPQPKVRRVIEDERPDVVVFGHSHRPTAVEVAGVLYFNPGSPTVRRQADVSLGVGLLHLSPAGIRHELIPLRPA
jgi:putative phosphoesterase